MSSRFQGFARLMGLGVRGIHKGLGFRVYTCMGYSLHSLNEGYIEDYIIGDFLRGL